MFVYCRELRVFYRSEAVRRCPGPDRLRVQFILCETLRFDIVRPVRVSEAMGFGTRSGAALLAQHAGSHYSPFITLFAQ